MDLRKNLLSCMLIGLLCSTSLIGRETNLDQGRTRYTQILAHIYYLRDAKFDFVRDILIKNFALNNKLPKIDQIKSMGLLSRSGKNDILIEATSTDKKNLKFEISSNNISLTVDKNSLESKNLPLLAPYFIASRVFVKQFNDQLKEVKQACSMLDLSDLLDETEELKDSINDYYSSLVPDTEASLYAELNENPKALKLLFALKKVQRNAILKLMILTKLNKKCQ